MRKLMHVGSLMQHAIFTFVMTFVSQEKIYISCYVLQVS